MPTPCAWRSQIDQKYRCNEPAAGRRELCCLHDPNAERDAFRKTFWRKREAGGSDFKGVVFRDSEEFDRELRDADFSEAVFHTQARFGQVSFVGSVDFRRAEFGGGAQFQGAQFSGPARFGGAKFRYNANFNGATFQESVRFDAAVFGQGADFSSVTFAGPAHFDHTTFQDEVTFQLSSFAHGGSFFWTKFLGQTSYHTTRFEGTFELSDVLRMRFVGSALFYGAIFNDPTDFFLTIFRHGVSFREAQFRGAVEFRSCSLQGIASLVEKSGNCVFRGSADFGETKCESIAVFERLILEGRMDVSRSHFEDSVFFRGPFWPPMKWETGPEGPYLSRSSTSPTAPELCFEDVLLEKPDQVFFDELDLSRTTFSGTNVRQVNFRNVHWPRKLCKSRLPAGNPVRKANTGTLNLRSRLHGLSKSLQLFLSHNTTADEFQSGSNTDKARRVCRDLKASLEDQHDYADAGDFYYAEMELRRQQSHWLQKSLYRFYWLVCGYGEKPLRALAVFLALWLGLATSLMQTLVTFDRSASWRAESCLSAGCRPSFREAIGHSIRSLTLQQRGGYVSPTSPGAHHLTLVANIIGPIQLGLFFLAMRRRFRR